MTSAQRERTLLRVPWKGCMVNGSSRARGKALRRVSATCSGVIGRKCICIFIKADLFANRSTKVVPQIYNLSFFVRTDFFIFTKI